MICLLLGVAKYTMPEDALAAEKPSFNRGPDGRTPFGVPLYRSRITALADEAMQCSGRGQYMLAQSTHDQIAGVVEDEKAHRVEEEKVRQREERLKLDRAYRIEKERFEAEWAERARLVEGESEEKLKVLREVLAIARDDVERELAAKAKAVALQFKASSKLLTLEDTERRLVGAREYAQAEEVARRARRLRKQEEARYERNKGGFIVKRREAMAKLQEAEMANLEQKCHGAKVQVRREREEALVVLKQRCARLDLSPYAPPAANLTPPSLPALRFRNLGMDLEHAHAIEYSLPAEIGQVQSYKSRSNQASTFRGTLKLESLVGTKFDVPDVSKMAPIGS